METAKALGLRVSSGTLNEVFNLELLLYPCSNALRGEAALPVVILLEGRGHFFTNALGRFTGDAEFRRFLVSYQAECLRKFRAVAQVTIWDWRNAKTQDSKLRVLRNVLRKHGLDPAMYIPPTVASMGVVKGVEVEEEIDEKGEETEEQVVMMRGGGPALAQEGGGEYTDSESTVTAAAYVPLPHVQKRGTWSSSGSAVSPSASSNNWDVMPSV